ncbi:MAG: ParB/Srx family N-terminal domain-containing protein [Rhodobacterales bacterium]|jgi:ParB-like chromosome segregation protein Spo0J
MQIEMMQIDRLVPYIRNARTHSAEQVAQIAASIVEFGFTNPIQIGEDGVIICGHGRLLAARSLGLAEVPVLVFDHLSATQRRGLVLADNQIAENAGWDERLKALELIALRDEDFDLPVIGFTEDEISTLMEGLDDLDNGIFGAGSGAGTTGLDDRTGADGSGGAAPPPVANATLAERFGIPPFSVLDARRC